MSDHHVVAKETEEMLLGVMKSIVAENSEASPIPISPWQRGVTLMLYAVASALIGLYALTIDPRYAGLLGTLSSVLLVLAGREFDLSSAIAKPTRGFSLSSVSRLQRVK